MSALNVAYLVLASLLAAAGLLGIAVRVIIRPVIRAVNRLHEALAAIEGHSATIAELQDSLEATIAVVLDAVDTTDRRLRVMEKAMGITPPRSLAQIVRETRRINLTRVEGEI